MTKKALIFTTGQGHESMAVVIRDLLAQAGWEVKQEKYAPEFKLHVFLHQHSAFLMRFFSQILLLPVFIPLQKFFLKYFFQKYVFSAINSWKPDLVISTFYLLNPSIEWGKQFFPYTFVNVFTDPRTFLPLNPSLQADINMVFDDFQEKMLTRNGNNSIKTQVLGWLVHTEFEKAEKKEAVRKRLSLDTKPLTFLITSGSLGNEESSQFLTFFLNQKRPLQIVFITGKNTGLLEKTKYFEHQNKNPLVTIRVLGYEKRMAAFMKAADLILGKAGPNTLFEAVAAGTPFFVTNYGGVQEKGNIEIIQQYHLGFTPQNMKEAQATLSKIIDTPNLLKTFEKDLKKMKTKNQQAQKKLLETINQLVKR